jgi:hypothetical protein
MQVAEERIYSVDKVTALKAQSSSKPERDICEVKSVLHYLKQTAEYGIIYGLEDPPRSRSQRIPPAAHIVIERNEGHAQHHGPRKAKKPRSNANEREPHETHTRKAPDPPTQVSQGGRTTGNRGQPQTTLKHCIVTERDGRKGPPAGNKTRRNRTHTPQSKAKRSRTKNTC